MRNIIVVFALMAVLSITAEGQSSAVGEILVEAKKALYQGNIRNDKQQVLHAYALLERASAVEPTNRLVTYYVAYAEYILARIAYAGKDDNVFEQYIDKAAERTENLLEQEKGWNEVAALLGTIYGIKISNSPMKGMILGPKATNLQQKAIAADSTNPRVWMVYGTMKLNTPAFFGGSVEEAQQAFSKSVTIFETKKSVDPLEPDWGYLDALVWLAKSYEKKEQLQEARAIFNKALNIEPNFGWVKHVLLPALEKKLSAK